MKKLVTVINSKIVDDLRDEKDITFLYPLKSFCVGYTQEFDIKDIKDFVLVNRILDDDDLDKLEIILKNGNFKGIVFDDLGILEIIKDLNITKILWLDHLAVNSISINYYLDCVDSVIVSSDITKDEIKNITKLAKKPVVISVAERKRLMYSRRKLLSNYEEYYNLAKKETLNASIEDKPFMIKENDYGTCFYAKTIIYAKDLLDLNNVLYFWYNLVDVDEIEAINLIHDNAQDILTNHGFLDTPSIYKVKGDLK